MNGWWDPQLWWELAPWLAAMGVLMVCSGFFSSSEAALFSLTASERRLLERGRTGQRAAARLLDQPERLLSAVLFWNLVVNMAYFALSSEVSLQLERRADGHGVPGLVFTAASLLGVIFFSEMLPKSLAVLQARRMAGWCGLPLGWFVRLVDPLMPVLQWVQLLSLRLLWPGFRGEPYLEVADLERAVRLTNEEVELEQSALASIVGLSDIRADEWMRPRTHFLTFRPPVSLAELGGRWTPSGYVLITEADSEEVAAAVALRRMVELPEQHLEHLAMPVSVVPWCAPVAEVLDRLLRQRRDVAAIVNEFGETIGILTIDDILATVFDDGPGQQRRPAMNYSLHEAAPGVWRVPGLTPIRRLARTLGEPLPATRSLTLTGVVQESLQRLPEAGDRCDWGEWTLVVLEIPRRGQLLIEMRRLASGESPA